MGLITGHYIVVVFVVAVLLRVVGGKRAIKRDGKLLRYMTICISSPHVDDI